ncbi:hypothetical protein BA939_02180 [Rhizobium sp. S41]|nr:hypothetical protein BA939_02180 [Rhizobium sp. S41]KGE79978.1 hypothetical protein LW14_25800 [Rhizobium sp. H41]
MVKPRENRIPIMFSEDELIEIDEWRHENRIATRADAVRRLCKIALFIEQELEPIVDNATEGVGVLADQSRELSEIFRAVINRETYGMTFDRDQLWDIFTVARENADVAEDGLRSIQSSLVTLYNAIAALVDARTIRSGQRKAETIVEEANAALDKMLAARAEGEKQSEDNRYLSMVFHAETQNDRKAYEAMSDDEQDAYLEQKIDELRQEEAADPQAFAKRYGIDTRKFWEKPEWQEFLEQRRVERGE